MSDMPSKDAVAIVAAAIGAAIAVFNWRGTRFRSKLKDDLDILKRYREEIAALLKRCSVTSAAT